MKSRLLLLLIVAIISGSCVKDKLETTYSKQETQIDTYLSRNSVSGTDTLAIEYNNGSARLVRKEGEGDRLTENGAVSFYYAGYIFTSSPSTLFATNHQETAEKAGFNVTDPDYEILEADMRDTRLLDGVRNGLIGVRAGEECEILFSGKYGFGNEIFGIIPANSALLFKIWVVGVSNE